VTLDDLLRAWQLCLIVTYTSPLTADLAQARISRRSSR
jgi:hypothetical protein